MMDPSWNSLNNENMYSFLQSFQMKYYFLYYFKMVEQFEMMEHLFQNVPTFQRICAQLEGNIVILQKVRPKVTKVELFEGLFLRNISTIFVQYGKFCINQFSV